MLQFVINSFDFILFLSDRFLQVLLYLITNLYTSKFHKFRLNHLNLFLCTCENADAFMQGRRQNQESLHSTTTPGHEHRMGK